MDFNYEVEVIFFFNVDEFISVCDDFINLWLYFDGKVLWFVYRLYDWYVSVNVMFEIFVNYD